MVEPASARTVLTVPLPGQPISIGYDTDADLALASTLDDQVCVIDLKAGRVARTIRTRPGPDPIAVLDL